MVKALTAMQIQIRNARFLFRFIQKMIASCHLAKWLIILIAVSIGCDDEVPDPPTSMRFNGLMRDASMTLIAPEDYSVSGGSELMMDMGMGGQESTGGMTESPCVQGSTRELSGCGLERCLSGQWVTEMNAREHIIASP